MSNVALELEDEPIEDAPVEPVTPEEPETPEAPAEPEPEVDEAELWKGFLEDEPEPTPQAPVQAAPPQPQDDQPWHAEISHEAAMQAAQIATANVEAQSTLSETLREYPQQIQQYASKVMGGLHPFYRNKQAALTIADAAIGRAVREGRYKPGAPKAPNPPSRTASPAAPQTTGDADFEKDVETWAKEWHEADGGKAGLEAHRREARKMLGGS